MKLNFRNKFKIEYLLMFVLVGTVYGGGLLVDFGYTDDFWLYFTQDNVAETYFAAARPITALAWGVSRDTVTTLNELRWLRGCGLIAIAGIAIVLYPEFYRLFRHKLFACSAALGIVFLPAMTVFANWATCWPYPWAILMVLLATKMIRQAIVYYSRNRRYSILMGSSGLALILVALGTYQPTITWFWLPVLLSWLSPRFHKSRNFSRRVLIWAFSGLLIFLLGFIAIKLYFMLTGIEPQSRAKLLTSPIPKLEALLRIQTPLCLNLWKVIDVTQKGQIIIVACSVGLVVTSGLVIAARRLVEKPRLWLGGLFLILAMSHAHWILIDDNPKNYRTAMTIASATAVLFFWSLWILLSAGKTSKTAIGFCGLILLLLSAGIARRNSSYYWIQPYSEAHQFLVNQLKTRVTADTSSIHIIRQSASEGLVQEKNIYSFGKPYTDFPDNDVVHIRGIINAALLDAGLRDRIPDLTVSHSRAMPRKNSSDNLVIDFRDLIKTFKTTESGFP